MLIQLLFSWSYLFPQSSAPIKCAVNDTISLAVYQSTGSALKIAPSVGFS